MLLMLISLTVQIILLHFKPYETRIDGALSNLNEILVMIYLYLLVGITEVNTNYELRDIFGWCLLGVVLFSFALNFIKMIVMVGIKWYQMRRLRSTQS